MSPDPPPDLPTAARDDFSALFEFLPIGAYLALPDGRPLRVNAALVRLDGYDSEAEMLGAVRDIGAGWYVDPQRREAFRQRLEGDGVVRNFVAEVRRRKTGERCWISQNAAIVRRNHGAPSHCEGTVEDISERIRDQQALQRSEQQFRQLAEQMPGMVFSLHFAPDGSRRYLYVSRGVRELYGVSPEEVMAHSDALDRFRHPDDRARLLAAIQAMIAGGGPRVAEFRIVLDDGTLKWLQLASNIVAHDASGVLRVGVIVDISERQRAEALRHERDRAETASQAKSQLLGRVSHELRTPLNAVLGFSQLMASDPTVSVQHRAWAAHIMASGRHLLGLVEDVLDLSSAQTGQLSLNAADVALAALVEDTWTMVRSAQPEPAVVFINQASAPLRVRADPRRLKQVLANVLSNAVKYNRPGGQVTVVSRRDGDGVLLQVGDTGCGMDQAQLARLFRAFERLGAEQGRIEGRGIGLALSLQLVEAMGGSISVDSTPGVGTRFGVWLPVGDVAAGGVAAGAPPLNPEPPR